MSRLKITKRTVDALHSAGNRDGFLWDSELKGFGVRCRPSGARYYFLKMRVGKRQRWLTIGQHGTPWTPEGARQEALRLLGQKAEGLDPASERDKLKTTSTVAELWAQFIEDRETRLKPTTLHEYRRQFETVIKPALGQMRAIDVQRADIVNLHRRMKESPYLANRIDAVLSKLFNYAKPFGVCPKDGNPADSIEKYEEKKRIAFLSSAQLADIGQALRDCLSEKLIDLWAAAAIRLLLFTGCRCGEILNLEWAHVDFEMAVLNLTDSKTGAKVVQLPAPALAVLTDLPRIANNPFVIVGKRKGAHLVNITKPWVQVKTKANLPALRIHDLRHSFGSVGAGAGLSLQIVGSLLGHTQTQTTKRYAHVQTNPLQEAVNTIGGRIAEAMEPKTHTAAVVEISSRGKKS